LKRLLIPAAAAVAAAILFSAAPGSAQTQSASIDRALPDRVTLSVTPKRDRTRPFTFTSTGRVVPPANYCASGVSPSSDANCIPLFCPPGATNASYCYVPPRALICSGTVNVRYQKRNTTISSRSVPLRADCTYRSRVTFKTLLRTRQGVLRVRARFLGNAVLLPRSAPIRTVRAG
jgi:hypothetical protein